MLVYGLFGLLAGLLFGLGFFWGWFGPLVTLIGVVVMLGGALIPSPMKPLFMTALLGFLLGLIFGSGLAVL